MATRLERMEQEAAQLAAKLEKKRARLNQEKRRQDTKRKILIGAAMLDAVAKGHVSEEQLRAMLDEHLTRPADRALFDLPKRAEP